MKYIVKRIVLFIVVLFFALTVNFIIPRLMPGNPVEVMIAKFQGRLNVQAIESLRKAFGLDKDKSIFEQYFEYLGRVLTGDFGISVSFFPTTVNEILARSLPWTIALVGTATVLSWLIGTVLGIYASWRSDSFIATLLLPLGLFTNSMPYFWFALIVNFVFSFVLRWFPLSGAYDPETQGIARLISILYHSILPAITLIVTSVGGWMLTMRNSMMSVLKEDYVKLAKAMGFSDKIVRQKFAARNAILPSFTGFAMSIGFIFSGALLTEIVFSYPGVGFMLYQAVMSIDYPLMQAIFFYITVAVLTANFLADLSYVLLDPRVRSGEK